MLHVSVHIACARTLLRKHYALHGVLSAGDGHPIVVVDGRKYLGQTASQATMVEVLRNMEDCPGPVRKSGRVKANNNDGFNYGSYTMRCRSTAEPHQQRWVVCLATCSTLLSCASMWIWPGFAACPFCSALHSESSFRDLWCPCTGEGQGQQGSNAARGRRYTLQQERQLAGGAAKGVLEIP